MVRLLLNTSQFLAHVSSVIIIIIIIIIIILFIERHIQRAVRGAVQHSKAALSVIIDIQVNYYF